MVGKRKEPPVLQASAAKRRGEEDEEVEEDIPWGTRPGMILEVSMRNFMCHQTFTFKPNQRLTFLSGENGSGKSAVLTAIVFALGGNARTASRGSSNKEFIRSGQTSAQVEVKLLNTGEEAYKQELYGNAIVVSRSVTQSSSTYKLKDSHGRIVVDKKVREELHRILLAFNIQVDNPIAVLNQDTAKTFLFKCDPEKLYQFFMKATQLDSCKNDYNMAAQDKTETENLIREKRASLPTLKKEMEKWEKKHNWHQNFKNKKDDLKQKKAALAWARVKEIENEKNDVEVKVEESNIKIGKYGEEVKKKKEDDKARMKEKRSIEAEIQLTVKKIDDAESKLQGLRTEKTNRMEKMKSVKKVYQEAHDKHHRVRSEKGALEAEIEKLRRTGTADFEERHRERQATIRQCREKIEEARSFQVTTENHLEHIRANLRDTEERAMDLRAEKEREAGSSRKIKQNLENLSRSGQNRLAAFADWMPRVVEEIKRSRKFQVQPIGPLGAYLKVKDGTSENVIRTLDHELTSKGLFNSFLVDRHQDQQELFRIFQSVGVRNKPNVFTCPFTTTRHNIENGRVYSDQFEVLIDALEVSDVNVFNRIVDSASLERILYISTDAEAQAALMHERNVPRNTAYACVANSFQYYPAPNYRSYHYEERISNLLKPNLEEYMQRLRHELAEQAVKVETIEGQIQQVQGEKMTHRREIEANENKLRSIKTKIRSLDAQIATLKNEEEAERPPDISALEEDLDNANKVLEAQARELKGVKEEFEARQADAKAAKEAFEAFNEEMSSMCDTEPLKAKLNKIENDLKISKTHIEHYEKRKNECSQVIVSLQDKMTGIEEKILELTGKAMSWSKERIDTRKTVASLQKDIFVMEESLKQQEEAQDSRQLVTEKFQEYRLTYSKASSQIQYMTTTVNFLEQMLKQRKDGFKEILQSTCKNINRNFATLLSARKYIGVLDFDHRENLLTIRVNPNQNGEAAGLDITREVRSLSGGEKSYSSVSLVLALWNAMTPPFRILDEFDVFMDSVNRKIAIDNIMNYATDDRKFQFLFLTPLGTANIDTSNDVKIIKLRKADA